MYAFVYYNGDFSDIGEPYKASHYHGYLKGLWKNGIPITYGGNGTNSNKPITSYMYSGNPSDPDGWSECSVGNEPACRRMVMSSGKYGETKTWTIGSYTIPNVGGTCPNIQPLRDQAKYAKAFFNRFLVNDIEDLYTYITVYPNPTSSKLFFNTPSSIKSIEIYGLDGKLILQKKLNSNYLTVNVLSNGLYYAKLLGKDGKVYQSKFMKE